VELSTGVRSDQTVILTGVESAKAYLAPLSLYNPAVYNLDGCAPMAFDNWDKLLYGIEGRECIVFLGSELPVESPEGKRCLPAWALALLSQF
jgi:hypothetical protein